LPDVLVCANERERVVQALKSNSSPEAHALPPAQLSPPPGHLVLSLSNSTFRRRRHRHLDTHARCTLSLHPDPRSSTTSSIRSLCPSSPLVARRQGVKRASPHSSQRRSLHLHAERTSLSESSAEPYRSQSHSPAH
jgi:hypothetical protein